MNLSFIALKGEVCQDLSGDVIAGVSQTLVPQGSRRSGTKSLVRKAKRVEIAMAVTSEHLHPRKKILDRETMGVKPDRDIIIMG